MRLVTLANGITCLAACCITDSNDEEPFALPIFFKP